MTPKKKASELTKKITDSLINSGARIGKICVKNCAIIFVDEILKDTHATSFFEEERIKYWKKVKTEIEKL